MTQMDIFYHDRNYSSKGIIDAACYGAFMRKSDEEANQLIEDLAKSNYRVPSEASGRNNRLIGAVIELSRITVIEVRLGALMSNSSN